MVLRLLYAAVFIVAAVFAYKSWAAHSAFSTLAEAPLGNSIGPKDADVTMIEIVDYRCSFCRQAHLVVEDLQKRNPNIRVVYRHFLVFGETSLHEAQLALAVGMQGHFEEIHNELMAREKPITDEYIEQTAIDLALDYNKLMQDLKGPEIGYFLLDNIDAIKTVGIGGTPTFIVGRTIYAPPKGVPTVEELEAFIAEAKK